MCIVFWFGLFRFGGLFVKRESRVPTEGSKEGPPCGRRSCSQRFLDWVKYPRIPDPIPGPHVRLNAGWSIADDIPVAVHRPGCPLGDGDPPDPFVLVDADVFYVRGLYKRGAVAPEHFVINGAWALHHNGARKSELPTGPGLRHPDDSVEGQLWRRKQGHGIIKSPCAPVMSYCLHF